MGRLAGHPRLLCGALILAGLLSGLPGGAQAQISGSTQAQGQSQPQASAETDRDRGLLQRFIEDNLSAEGRDVQIAGFAGALSGRASLERLSIADADGVWLELGEVVLDWNRAALLSGRLEVAELTAQTLEVRRAPRPPEASLPSATAGTSAGFALPELPVAINIATLALERVTLGPSLLGETVVLRMEGGARLSDGTGTADLSVTRLDGPVGLFELSGGYDNASRQLRLGLEITEEAGGLIATLTDLPGRPDLHLNLDGDAPIDDFRADIVLQTAGAERLRGAVTLETLAEPAADETDAGASDATEAPPAPPWTRQRIEAQLSGDLAPVFAPQYRDFFGPDVSLQLLAAVASDDSIALQALQIDTRSLTLIGNGVLAPDRWPEHFQLIAQLADPDAASVLVPVGAEGTRVASADLELLYDRERGDSWQLQGVLTGVETPDLALGLLSLAGGGAVRVPQAGAAGALDGELSLLTTGLRPADPALERAIGPALRGGLRFDWATDGPLVLRDIALTGADYRLGGAVTLARAADALDLRIALETELAADDLSRFAPLAGLALGGAGSLSIAGDVAPVAGAVDLAIAGETRDLRLGQPQLDPLLADTATLRLRAIRDGSGTRIEGLELQSPHAQLQGAAALSETAGQVTLRADLPQISRVLPALTGPAALELAAQTDAADLNSWQSSAALSLPGQTRLTWAGRLADLDRRARVEGQLGLGIGTLSAFARLAGQPLSGALQAEVQLAAMLDDLSGTAALRAQTTSIGLGIDVLDDLLRGAGSLQVDLQRDASGRITVDQARIATPNLQADLDGATTDTARNVTFSARIPNGRIIAPELDGAITAEGRAATTGGDWTLAVQASGPAGLSLNASGSLAPNGARAALALSGQAPLALANARLRPRAVSGIARYDLRLDGPLALSSLSGGITVPRAEFSAPQERLSIDDLRADIRLGGGQAQLDVAGRFATGGRLAITGPVGLQAPFNADLSARLDRIRLRDPQLYTTRASGEIGLQGPLAGGGRIRGALELEETELRIPAGGGPRFANLPGLIHINEPAEVRRTRTWAGLVEPAGQPARTAAGPAYDIDLVIRAPARIFVRGRGLDAELGGILRLGGTTRDLVPQGRFDLVRGRFDLAGQRLVLEQGFLQLQGSFDPFISFVATTQVGDVAASVRLEGPATAPELTLSSSPDLPQDEILSLILFGRDITQISALQAVQLANAVRTLSGQGGEGVTSRLRRELALDDFDISTDDDGTIQARAGRYISDNIYTDVVVGADGQTEINLNLQVSPRLTVRGRVDGTGETGIGIYFERDY